MYDRLRRGLTASFFAFVAVLAVACATPTAGPADPSRDLPLSDASALPDGMAQIVDVLSPTVERARDRLEMRLDAAHRRHGRGRPPVTRVSLGELGLGSRQGFSVRLRRGRCYSVVAVTDSDDQELDLVLLDGGGDPLGRSAGQEAAVEVCPTVDGTFRVSLTMYRGSGPFALGIFGS